MSINKSIRSETVRFRNLKVSELSIVVNLLRTPVELPLLQKFADHQAARQCSLDQKMEGRAGMQSKDQWNQMGCEEKKVVVHEEMKRMSQLPANSSYATHRLRVLNKILQLLSLQRTTSQDEELELLFAGLHM